LPGASPAYSAARAVTFRKRQGEAPPQPAERRLPVATGDEPPILKRLDVGPGWGVALVLGGAAIIAGIGAFALRGVMRRRGEQD